jgi:hypothetical protein
LEIPSQEQRTKVKKLPPLAAAAARELAGGEAIVLVVAIPLTSSNTAFCQNWNHEARSFPKLAIALQGFGSSSAGLGCCDIFRLDFTDSVFQCRNKSNTASAAFAAHSIAYPRHAARSG